MTVNYDEFTILWKDIEMAEVKFTSSEFECTNINEHIKNPLNLYSLTPEKNDIIKFLKDQIFDEHNANKEGILANLGLTTYNLWDIVELTNAFSLRNHWWIRFKGQEGLTWDKVKLDMLTKGRVVGDY